MNIKDLPHVTVEQVLALREAAIELEQEVTAYRISLENLEASLPKIRADAIRGMLYCIEMAIEHNFISMREVE
jgi:hypothetical protein